MSKQTGLITFKGKMGNISFFKRNGESHARLRGGFSKERLAKDPKLKRVRENISEFNGLAQTVKSFRSILGMVSGMKDGTLNNRLTKVFSMINKRSEGIRGQRPVMVSEQRPLLLGLELNALQNFSAVFAAPFTLTYNNRENANVEIINLSVNGMVKAPPSATHFRLVQLLGAVADTVFDQNSQKYAPLHPTLNGLSQVTYSDYLPVNSAVPINVALQTAFPAQELPPDLTMIHALGIVFYDQSGAEYYSLSQGQAMKVVNVY